MALLATGQLTVVATVECFATGLLAFPPISGVYQMDSFPTDTMAGDLGAVRSMYVGPGQPGAIR